jgi:signal transduction histidine kinase
MARDLHDGLGHSLVALSVQLEAVQRLYPVDPARASAQIDDMKRLTRDSMAELRRTLDALRTPGLGDQSLREALESLCAALATRSGIEVSWVVGDDVDLPPAVAEAVWRVAQEALANVERHAVATSARLVLETQPDAVVLTVSDDGRGLPPDAETRPGHYGLRGMRERVEGLGGTLTLSANRHGTVVQARLPVVTGPPRPSAQ